MTESEVRYDEYDYVDPVPAALECPICRSALIDPVQTPKCDHLFCRSCLAKSLSLNPSCPIDRTRLDSVESCSTPHRAILHLLSELRVNYDGATVTRDEADRRATSPAAAAATAATAASSDADTIDTKEQPDDDMPTVCDYCTLVLPRSAHPNHLLTTCAVVPLPCPHARRGCPYSGPRALLEQDHLPSECVYEPLRAYLDRTDEVHARLEGENWELRATVNKMERTIDALVQSVQGLQASLGEFAPPGAALPRPLGDQSTSTVGGPFSSTTGRPRPTKRAASSPSTSTSTRDPPLALPNLGSTPCGSISSSGSGAIPSAVPPISPLSSTLSHLESTQSHLSSSLSTLLQSHSHSLATTRAVQEELASLRTQLTGVRIQMGGVMRDVYGAGSGSGAGRRLRAGGGGGGGTMGGYGAGGGPLGSQVPSMRVHPGLGSSGSSDEDLPGRDGLLQHSHHHHHHAGGNMMPLSSPSSYEDEEDDDEAEYYQHPYGPPTTSRSAPDPLRLGQDQQTHQQFPFWRPTAGGALAPGTGMPMPFPNGMRPVVPAGLHPTGPPHHLHGMAIPGMMGAGAIGNGLVKL